MPAAVLGEAEVEGGVELVGPQIGEVVVLLLPAMLSGVAAGRVHEGVLGEPRREHGMTHNNQHEHEQDQAAAPVADRPGESSPAGRAMVRHRFPGRDRVVKVRYDEQEHRALIAAAGRAGLTPSGFLAAAGLSVATGQRPPAPTVDREGLGELLALRTAIVRYGVLVNQALAAWHSTGNAPVWLQQAMHGAHRAVRRVDEATDRLVRSR